MNFEQDVLYKILFLDHAVGIDEAIKCEVVGWVTKDSDVAVTLSHWMVRHEDEEVVRGNTEHTTLVKRAILNVQKIENKPTQLSDNKE
jgi:hypothetical protein